MVLVLFHVWAESSASYKVLLVILYVMHYGILDVRQVMSCHNANYIRWNECMS